MPPRKAGEEEVDQQDGESAELPSDLRMAIVPIRSVKKAWMLLATAIPPIISVIKPTRPR
ncbi:MAG: hypothetical protein MPW15_18275 [Candidatus Manganitrophus sp.]|nr:hypothetical protein [Candidatus Manganitrophus sp.]